MRKLHNALEPLRLHSYRYRDLHYGTKAPGQLIIGKKKVGAPIHFSHAWLILQFCREKTLDNFSTTQIILYKHSNVAIFEKKSLRGIFS